MTPRSVAKSMPSSRENCVNASVAQRVGEPTPLGDFVSTLIEQLSNCEFVAEVARPLVRMGRVRSRDARTSLS